MHDSDYIMYNQQLAPRCKIRDEIDPIDECTEQLEGQVDDNDNDNEVREMIWFL